jgi:hypothetical protein
MSPQVTYNTCQMSLKRLRAKAGHDILHDSIELVSPTPDTKEPGAVSFARRVTAP